MQSCRQLQFPVTFISVFRVFCTFSGRMDTCTVHPINPTSNNDKLLWCLLVEVFFKRKLFFPQQGKISQNTIDPCPLQCNSKVMKCCENRFKLLKPLLKLPMFTSQFEKFQTASVKIWPEGISKLECMKFMNYVSYIWRHSFNCDSKDFSCSVVLASL